MNGKTKIFIKKMIGLQNRMIKGRNMIKNQISFIYDSIYIYDFSILTNRSTDQVRIILLISNLVKGLLCYTK